MAFPRPSTPLAALRDLRAFLSTGGRSRWLIAIISILMPCVIVFGFYLDSNIKPVPRIVYVQSWPANRTDEEIKAQQKIDQAAREKAFEERRRQYQAVADKLGIDTSR